MREFRYVFQKGEIIEFLHVSLENLEDGTFLNEIEKRQKDGFHIVSRDMKTGLKDREGNEIYENDIIGFMDKYEWYRPRYPFEPRDFFDTLEIYTRKVKWIEKKASFNFCPPSELCQYWEVVGNVHTS